MVITLAAYFVFMWRIHPSLTLACLSVADAAGVGDAILFRPPASGLSAQSRIVRQPGATFHRKRAGHANRQGICRRAGSRAAVRGRPTIRCPRSNNEYSGICRIFTPVTQLLSQLSLVILFAYGGWLLCAGADPLGSGLVVFAGLLQQFTGQVANLSTIANSVQQSLTAARRVFEVLDTPLEVQNRPARLCPARLTGRIVFERVTFGYRAGDAGAARNFVCGEAGPGDWHFRHDRRGQDHVAESDSAILRSAARAAFCVDGPNCANWISTLIAGRSASCIRKVFCSPTPWRRTSLSAIRTRRRNRSNRRRGLRPRTNSSSPCRNGYQTVLGESGVDLSGGQRQRLALARALLLQPPILILDDPTASVDARTEHEIVSALRQAMVGRTTFVVANRLSLVAARGCHFGLWTKAGLSRTGTHEEIVRVPGPYREAAMLQLVDLAMEEGIGDMSASPPTAAATIRSLADNNRAAHPDPREAITYYLADG